MTAGGPMQRAALRVLDGWPSDATPETGHVQRVSVDVNLGDGNELVALRLSPQGLSWVCSCGQPRCAHAHAALSLIAGQEHSSAGRLSAASPVPAAQAPATGGAALVEERSSDVYESGLSSSPEVRIVDQSDRAYHADAEGLARALDDVVTAVARVGAHAGEAAASIQDSLLPLLEVAPRPTPLGIARWVGRLKLALATRDVEALSRVLHGASRLAADLRVDAPDAEARTRIGSWLGALSGDVNAVERMSDRTMLEVAREWLDGVELDSVERRYLLDLRSGEVFREELLRGSSASLGSCPRTLHVGLAEVERGAAPRRIRLLQYAATPTISQGAWDRAAAWAVRDFSTLADGYRSAITAFPGIAEPFAIVQHASLSAGPSHCLLDAGDRPLPLTAAPQPEGLTYLSSVLNAGPAQWIAGRLVDTAGSLHLRPLSATVTVLGRSVHHSI